MNRVDGLIEEIFCREHHSFDYMNMQSARKVIIANIYARPKKIKRLFLTSVKRLFHLVHIVYKIQQRGYSLRTTQATTSALGRESLSNFKASRVTFLA